MYPKNVYKKEETQISFSNPQAEIYITKKLLKILIWTYQNLMLPAKLELYSVLLLDVKLLLYSVHFLQKGKENILNRYYNFFKYVNINLYKKTQEKRNITLYTS